MAVLEKISKAGSPNRGVASGQPVVLYETTDTLGNAEVFNTPVSSLSDSFLDTPPAAGDWIKRGSIRELVISILADENGGASGVVVQESMDGSTVANTAYAATLAADTYLGHILELTADYFRFSFTNGATEQGAFDCRVSGRS